MYLLLTTDMYLLCKSSYIFLSTTNEISLVKCLFFVPGAGLLAHLIATFEFALIGHCDSFSLVLILR